MDGSEACLEETGHLRHTDEKEKSFGGMSCGCRSSIAAQPSAVSDADSRVIHVHGHTAWCIRPSTYLMPAASKLNSGISIK
jgi:hypothetical protein